MGCKVIHASSLTAAQRRAAPPQYSRRDVARLHQICTLHNQLSPARPGPAAPGGNPADASCRATASPAAIDPSQQVQAAQATFFSAAVPSPSLPGRPAGRCRQRSPPAAATSAGGAEAHHPRKETIRTGCWRKTTVAALSVAGEPRPRHPALHAGEEQAGSAPDPGPSRTQCSRRRIQRLRTDPATRTYRDRRAARPQGLGSSRAREGPHPTGGSCLTARGSVFPGEESLPARSHGKSVTH